MARNNPKSQRNFVINYLNHYKTITSMEAFKYYGITRLSAIIHTLRNIHHIFNKRIKCMISIRK